MTHSQLWAACRAAVPGVGEDYEAWAFGGDPGGLARLVLAGAKTATCSAGVWYEGPETEPLPRAGADSVVLDSREEAACIIRTTKVYTVPFSQVSPDHAWREGEGNRSLNDWRNVHGAFFRAELEEAGLAFDPHMPVVCEEFELVFSAPELS